MCGLGSFVIQTFYAGYPVCTKEENTVGQMTVLWMFPAAYGRLGSPPQKPFQALAPFITSSGIKVRLIPTSFFSSNTKGKLI